MGKWFMSLPPWMQFILILLAILIVWWVFKKSAVAVETATDKIQTAQEQKELEQSGQKPSYSDGVYRDMADKLEAAMTGAGTDTLSVGYVFLQMKNDMDVLKLDKAFGTRKEANLSQWLHGEWSISVTHINAALRERGIKKQF